MLKRKHAIGLKWIFNLKHHVDSSIQRHKVRLVERGSCNNKVYFSPIARLETMRILLVLVAQFNWLVLMLNFLIAS